MTTTTNTPDDFIQLLRDDPGFRRTVRREILTEDLLGVPNRLSRVERSIEILLESTAVLQETTAALQESNATINRRLDMVERQINLVGQNVDRMEQTIREQTQAQSSFRGNYAQNAGIEGSLGVASLFELGSPRRVELELRFYVVAFGVFLDRVSKIALAPRIDLVHFTA